MSHPIKTATAFGLLGLLACTPACSDATVEDEPSTELTTKAQSVVVVPEFEINGVEDLPGRLVLTDLGLNVSEIKLEPLHDDDAPAYATRKPISLHFDVHNGQLVHQGAPITLPQKGRYIVSVRLEPTQQDDEERPSFTMDGFLGADPEATVDEKSDGIPVPLPFDERREDGEPLDGELHDNHESPEIWTPFSYKSRAAVFVNLAQVDLENGTQQLRFSFDIQTWAVDVIEPISKAVKHTSTSEGSSVDITEILDATGRGANAIIDHTQVNLAQKP